jgi:hypothetical protein
VRGRDGPAAGEEEAGQGPLARADWLLALGAAAAVCIVYAPAISLGFYSEDYFWLAATKAALERPLFLLMVNFRDFNPLMHLSFVVDWLLGRGSPVPYHLSQVLLHGVCTLLLVLLGRRLGAARWLALVAALCWGLNVRLSEAVIWPATRGHPLATLFILAAAYGVVARWPVLAVGGLAVGGLLSKETAFFPMLLLPWLAVGRPRQRRLVLVVGLLAVANVVFNLVAKPSLHLAGQSWWERMLKAPFILLRPLGLGDLYPFTAVAMLLVAGLWLALGVLLRRSRGGLFGFAWVTISLLPVLLLPHLSSRYLYLPAVGYALILCGALEAAKQRLESRRLRRVAIAGGCLLAALLGIANGIWIQREIVDYQLLAEPYEHCLELFREPLAELAPGETVVVYDLSPRDGPQRLNQLVVERGTMLKLIPYRSAGVGGLITLPNLINVIRPPTPGVLAAPAEPATSGEARHLLYDGQRVERLPGPPPYEVESARIFAAKWGDAAAYFAARSLPESMQ